MHSSVNQNFPVGRLRTPAPHPLYSRCSHDILNLILHRHIVFISEGR